jgi:hypothetical protein
MVYFAYGFPHSYKVHHYAGHENGDAEPAGGEDTALVASAWVTPAPSETDGNGWQSSSLACLLVLVTPRGVEFWSGGQHRYLMGSWAAANGDTVVHAVVSASGLVGLIVRRCLSLGTEGDGYELMVISASKKVTLDSLSWAELKELRSEGEGVAVEEATVEVAWRKEFSSFPMSLNSNNTMIGLLGCREAREFWAVWEDGQCVGFDWFSGISREGMIGLGGPRSEQAKKKIIMLGSHEGFCGRFSIVWEDAQGTSVGLVAFGGLSEANEQSGVGVTFEAQVVEHFSVPVQKVSLCPKGTHLAIGMAEGEVILRNAPLGKSFDRNAGMQDRVLSLDDWGYTGKELGGVSELAWSPDGKVIAVGYERQGVSAWTTNGCRLFCTLVACSTIPTTNSPRMMVVGDRKDQEGAVQGLVAHRRRSEELVTKGSNPFLSVSHASFSQSGMQMILQSTKYPHMLLEVAFAQCFENHRIQRKKMTGSHNRGWAFSLLIGADRLLLITPKLSTQHISVPQQYLDAAYPIRTASLNPSQEDVIVAGVHGLALYSVPNAKWRLIGDRSQDYAIRARHVGWLSDDVVVVCANIQHSRGKRSALGGHGTKLCFFPKSHLDGSSMLGSHEIPANLGMPKIMDVSYGRILLVFETHLVQVLRYELKGLDKAVELDLEFSFKIPQSSAIDEYPCMDDGIKAMSFMQKGDGHPSCLLLWESGDLGFMDLLDESLEMLSEGIEYYWIPEFEDSNVENPWWWTYGSKGMTLWRGTACDQTVDEASVRDPELGFDNEVIPIGISFEDMSVVGLMHRMHTRRGIYDNPCCSIDFAPQPERQPILACLLRRLIFNDELLEAVKLADLYSMKPDFARSLEWLLYTALEASGSGKNDTESELNKIIELISKFTQFPQLVVSVARKVEADLWPVLFEAAGPPVSLCENLILEGALDHASYFLLIVYELAGPSEASRLAMKTLKLALSTSKYKLCVELLHFLADSSCPPPSPSNTNEQEGQENNSYVAWLWSWIAPEEAQRPDGRDVSPSPSRATPSSSTITEKLHASVSRKLSSEASDAYNDPVVDAWKLLAKQAWRLLDDGNIRELASLDWAISGLHGGLAALLRTTIQLHSCSLGHITPSASLIANALFIAGNEIASATEAELGSIPRLMQSLLSAGCINYGVALAISMNDAIVMLDFAENNEHTWNNLQALISNDVHLCSYASVLSSVAPISGLARTLTV